MKEIRFQNPIFKDGLNVTVRTGHRNYEIGELVKIQNTTADVEIHNKTAKVLFLHVCKFQDIPQWILDNEHDPSCRNWSGLKRVMKLIYPDMNIEDIITCIGFMFME